MENKNKSIFEKVSFPYSYDILKESLTADSAYIARSLYDISAEKSSVVSLIITEDDHDFIASRISRACVDMVTRLVAYIGEETQFEEEPYTFVLNLPTYRNETIDMLISHELQRAVVAHVLSGWYELRLPEMAARQRQLYEAAIAMVRHDIYMARGKVYRAGSYF